MSADVPSCKNDYSINIQSHRRQVNLFNKNNSGLKTMVLLIKISLITREFTPVDRINTWAVKYNYTHNN